LQEATIVSLGRDENSKLKIQCLIPSAPSKSQRIVSRTIVRHGLCEKPLGISTLIED
jgi:hypothetical protein